jgi:hypothetical protein
LGGPKAREAFGALREAFKTPKALTDFKSTEEGLIPLAAGELPYLIVGLPAGPKVPAGPLYAALVRFKNAPHDVVMVTVSRAGTTGASLALTGPSITESVARNGRERHRPLNDSKEQETQSTLC